MPANSDTDNTLATLANADIGNNSVTSQQTISSDDEKRLKLAKEIQKEEDDNLNNFEVAKPYLNELVTRFAGEEHRTEANRLARDIEVDVDFLRDQGEIQDDEAFIPVRIIHNNIQKEMPSYMNYIRNSRRICIFTDSLDSSFDTQELESEFTKKMTYPKWEREHYKCLDSSLTHGWSWIEVCYDPTKPANCALEYIAHEDLIIPLDCKDIQTALCVLRRYKVTPSQLKSWVIKFDFDLLQANALIEHNKAKTDKDRTIILYKRYIKYNGCVYSSWFSLEGGCNDWLKKPAKHYVGIDKLVEKQSATAPSLDPMTGQLVPGRPAVQDWEPIELDQYPIFLLVYKETEEPYIFDHKGRVYFDKHKQEAQTSLWTSFVNGTSRAQRTFASPTSDTVGDGKPAKQLANISWDNGTIFDKPLNFWSMPYPPVELIKVLEYADTSNLEEIGQTNFAAMNREDSRKTAREISAAQQQAQLLDSVDLTLYSTFLREVYGFAWLIVRSQALQGKIKFLQKLTALQALPAPLNPQQQVQIDPIQSVVNVEGAYQDELKGFSNDIDKIIRIYDVRAAGDVDVIQKQELVMQMKQDWPVYQSTPLASRFLSDLTRLSYPQDSAVYSALLSTGNPKNNVIQSLLSFVEQLMTSDQPVGQMLRNEMGPQEKLQMQQLVVSAQKSLQSP